MSYVRRPVSRDPVFITLRTVEMHLSNAFRERRISTRTQLPAALTSEVEAVAAGRT